MYQFELDLSSEEEWRPIPGYDGYAASNLGRIKSRFGRQLHFSRNDGYPVARIRIINGGERRILFRFVHRLVALAHIPNPQGKPQVNHLNGIKHDNRSQNLEWCTAMENTDHAWRTGLHFPHKRKPTPKTRRNKRSHGMGELNASAKLTEDQVRSIFSMKAEGETNARLAGRFNVCKKCISSILNGRRWKHLNLAKPSINLPPPRN